MMLTARAKFIPLEERSYLLYKMTLPRQKMSSKEVEVAFNPRREVALAIDCGIVSLFATDSEEVKRRACGKSISVTRTQRGIKVDQERTLESGKKEATMLLSKTKLEKMTREKIAIAAASQNE